MKRVFYNSRADDALYAMIREAARNRFELVTLDHDDDDERVRKLSDVEAIVVASTPLTKNLIDAAPKLEFVHHQGVGYQDTVDTAALAARNIPLAITPTGTTIGVAEHAIMLMISALRRIPFADSELRQGRFHVNALRPVSRELSGRTVGLVGMGRIGQAVAERLKPFGVKMIYYDPLPRPQGADESLGIRRRTFDELLAEAEIVSLHLPLTAATRHIVNASTVQKMKQGSYLINTARGGLVDEKALLAGLEEGRIAGAALDVFDPEPPKPDNPLFRLPSVVMTPHIAAGTRDAFLEKMSFIFSNLERYWQGKQVENLVDLKPAPSGKIK
jgi:phosphoglycerate dehydrogenase-like enzyme